MSRRKLHYSFGLDRSDKIVAAVNHYELNCSAPEVLMDKFNISYSDAIGAVTEGKKRQRERILLSENVEKEIEGMDWQYNPEREIKNLTIPRY